MLGLRLCSDVEKLISWRHLFLSSSFILFKANVIHHFYYYSSLVAGNPIHVFSDQNFEFKKKKDSTTIDAKTKALVNCAVTAQLICVFVFAYAERCFDQCINLTHA